MYAAREVFPNSPLEYVAAEVRYPYAPRLHQAAIRDAILLDLEDIFPILRPQQHLTVTGTLGGPVSQQVDQIVRAFSRSGTTGLGLTASALILDTTGYSTFEDFRLTLSRCLAAVDKHASPAAIERVGLRYVNEIRVPDTIKDARDWRGWISDRLVDVTTIDKQHEVVGLQGAVEYTTGNDRSLTLRFNSAQEGTVIGNEPLKRLDPQPKGPFFVLDLDSFWQPPTQASPLWSVETIIAAINELHDPVGATFQSAITDKLRDSVLRRKS